MPDFPVHHQLLERLLRLPEDTSDLPHCLAWEEAQCVLTVVNCQMPGSSLPALPSSCAFFPVSCQNLLSGNLSVKCSVVKAGLYQGG